MIQARKASKAPEQPLRVAGISPESRLDPFSGNWTIFAPDRENRPEDFVEQDEVVAEKHVDCPFCPGNESQTPAPVWIGRVADDDSSTETINPTHFDASDDDWAVRVVPNKFPAVDAIDAADLPRSTKLFQRGPIRGGHEVIIESRNHVQSLTELDLPERHLVFKALRDRLRYWRDVPSVAYISAFKNVGSKAGASLCHAHSQLIATDNMPPAVRAAVSRMNHHRAATGCCLQCDLIRAELRAKQRIIWEDDTLVAYCPFASHLPMLVRLTSLEHQACFEDLSDRKIEAVSRIVGRVISWIEKLRPGTAYNICLHTRPPGESDSGDAFHWWLEIFPRMTQLAGFEWSCQCTINPVLPEAAAAEYRKCALAEDPRVLLSDE